MDRGRIRAEKLARRLVRAEEVLHALLQDGVAAARLRQLGRLFPGGRQIQGGMKQLLHSVQIFTHNSSAGGEALLIHPQTALEKGQARSQNPGRFSVCLREFLV